MPSPTNGTPATLTITNAQASDAGNFTAVFSNACGSATSDAATVTICCAADFDCNGFVTGDDFDEYVAAFEAGTTDADFNGDGFVNGDDFDAFVDAFEAGC